MAARSFQLVLAAAAQRLSDVYGDGVGVVHAAHDLPYRQILLTAAVADAFLGGPDHGVDTTSVNYGLRVEFVLQPVTIGPYETGPVKLSDLWAAGNGSTLHILAIPF